MYCAKTLRRLHSFLWDGIIAGTVPVCLEGEGSIGGCLVAHSWCTGTHCSHQSLSESLLQSAEGFWRRQPALRNWWEKQVQTIGVIRISQFEQMQVYLRVLVSLVEVIWHVWYSRSWSWSLPPPQSWRCRRSLVRGLFWRRSVSRSRRSSQTSFSRMWNLGPGLL